jgi:hypothetical protein
MSNNLQNTAIKANLAKVNLAVNTLHALGLTVNAVALDDSRPQIAITSGRGCNQLKPGVTRYINRDGRRVVQHTCLMSDCAISWEEIQ